MKRFTPEIRFCKEKLSRLSMNRPTIVVFANGLLYLGVFCKRFSKSLSALWHAKPKFSLRCAQSEKPCDPAQHFPTFFSSLCASDDRENKGPSPAPPQNFLRAARARYQRKRVTQFSVVKIASDCVHQITEIAEKTGDPV